MYTMRAIASKFAVLMTFVLVACDGNAAGKLMIVGGALRSDNEAVYREYIAAMPRDLPDVAIVPAASGRPMRYATEFRDDLRNFGFEGQVRILPIAIKDDPGTPEDESRWAEGGFSEELADSLKTAGGIWFVGGDQTRITETLMTGEGEDGPVLAAIRRQLEKGAVVGGTSAGAAIMSSPMIAAGDSLSALTEPRTEEYSGMQAQESGRLVLKSGLGFFDAGIVDQHFDRKSRLGRLVRALEPPLQPALRRGFGIDEDTAVLVDLDSAEMRVLGPGNLILVDARDAQFDQEGSRFAVRDMKLSVFSEGDSYNWKTGTVRMEGAATGGQEAFSYVAEQGAGIALPNSRLDHLLGFSLMDNSKTSELRRYAFNEAGEGVLFRFQQTDSSQGFWRYGSGTKDQYSIRDVLFSIDPVAVKIQK